MAQNAFEVTIFDNDDHKPIVGASVIVTGTNLGGVSGLDGGVRIVNIPPGKQTIQVSFVGYETVIKIINFPLQSAEHMVIRLAAGQELEEVYVTATRSSRSIEDIPTRMEAITAEELGEKAVMNSSNISMLLKESSGILVQQTSANSVNQTLRIQGLDGRYTQILKDGFPLYSSFSSGLSIMQVPPLDLRQVEIIKGSASTLYGGGAIAGLVNLVSKEPIQDEPELSLMVNQTTALGTTANIFWAQRFAKTGFTLYATGNHQKAYDANNDNFSDIPRVRSFSLNPKFFWYPDDDTELWFGVNTLFENRLGGDLHVIENDPEPMRTFSEKNLSKRVSTQFNLQHSQASGATLTFKNSVGYFNRGIDVPGLHFGGSQVATFSEGSWSRNGENSDWIIGVNVFTDHFLEDDPSSFSSVRRDYSLLTGGLFVQNNFSLTPKFTLESGLRTDYNQHFDLFVLPRLSALFKANNKLTFRLGGGLGYKLPTIFTEEAETLYFTNIDPIAFDGIDAEKSIGTNFDVHYKTLIGNNLTFSINQLFFYTNLKKSLVLEQGPSDNYFFNNADGPIFSKGIESNIKFTLSDFILYLQYSFMDVELLYNNINKQKPLTPKHNLGITLMYEKEHSWRIGYELYYTDQQFRNDYSKTRDYWVMGFMMMRELGRFSVFLNFENFTDTRQSRYQDMISPPYSAPTFSEVWAPTDGFVANGGFIYQLLR